LTTRQCLVYIFVYSTQYTRGSRYVQRKRAQNSQRTVKAFEADIAWINKEAKLRGCVAAEVIHELCEASRRKAYLQELGETFDLLNENAERLAAFKAETEAWDCTAADGLTDAT
jgi:dihydroxyacetone kinase